MSSKVSLALILFAVFTFSYARVFNKERFSRFLTTNSTKDETPEAAVPAPTPAAAPQPSPAPAPEPVPSPSPNPAPAPEQKTQTVTEDKRFFLLPVQVGTPPQTVVLSVETSSDYSWFPSLKCQECDDNVSKYDTSKSTSFAGTTDTVTITDRDGSITGTVANDDVSINNYKAGDYNFLVVDNLPKDYSDYSSGKLSLSYKSPGGKGLLDSLKDNDQIGKRIISFTRNDGKSQFYIGEYPEGFDINTLNTCSISSNLDNLSDEFRNKWVCDLSNGIFGKDPKNAFDINGFAYFDSGSYSSTAPNKFQDAFKSKYTDKCDEVSSKGEVFYECDKSLVDLEAADDLYLVFNGRAFQIPAESLFQLNLDGKKYTFTIRFNNSSDVWRIGQNFISQYTTVFNQEDSTVGFSGGNTFEFSSESSSSAAAVPESEEERQKKMKLIWTVAGGVLVVVFLILVVLCVFRSVRKPTEEDKPLIKA